MASLTVIKGTDRGKRFELAEPVPTIGRDAKNSIRLHDSEISRQHAELRWTGNGFILRDLKSSNGTYLNNDRVDSSPLKTGDRIRVGQTELIFTGGPLSPQRTGDLADKISMITQAPAPESSAIVLSIKQSEGSQYLHHPERAESPWLHEALSNLSVMYETSLAVNRIADIDQLLAHILDLVFQSIRADRGCVMIKDPETDMLRPSAVRYAQGANAQERITLSRTIADWVLERNEGVIVVDAAQDSRFSAAQSVVQLGIREAICVPLRGRHDTLGVMYVDTKSDSKALLQHQKPTKFSDDHLRLMIAIAHQAGLAIEDSRFYQAMMQAERLAAVGQTIASVSHHIKNILQGLRSGSYLVEMGLKEKKFDLLDQGWSVVQKNQDKIYNLVMDMLTYSKEREPALEMADVNRTCTEVAELLAARAQQLGIALETNLDRDLPEIAIDPEGIHRALLNIVSNALDAVEPTGAGRVELETGLDPSSRYIWITVTDNGSGIPPDQVERIFQVFVSTKGSKGTGLGLPVSRKILHEHGGAIRVKSTLGKGSKFILELPLRRLPAQPSQLMTQTITTSNLEFTTQIGSGPIEPPDTEE